jgi:biopolymer transport protein ExbD
MKRNKEEGMGVNLGIIITPMLDMSFQILAFFIMTYHPSALEGHFDLKLLPPRAATKGTPSAPSETLPPAGEDPELTDVLTVTVKAVNKGQAEGARLEGDPSRILLAQKQDAAPVLVADSDVPFEEGLKKLGAELKEYLADPSNSKANIKIEPDPNLKHQFTMQVYDVCKLAGFQNIQFVGPAGLPMQQE